MNLTIQWEVAYFISGPSLVVKVISTSEQHAEHLFAGQNTQDTNIE